MQPSIIICRLIAELPVPHSKNASKSKCMKCGKEVWVSQNTLGYMKQGAKIYCAPCSVEVSKDKDHIVIGSQNQLREVSDSLRTHQRRN